METESNLSDILNETEPSPDLNADEPEVKAEDAEAPTEGAEAEPAPEPTETPEKATDEPEKGDKEPDAPPAPAEEKKEPDLPTVPIASLHDERRKRQDLERRVAEMQQQLKQEPAPDPIEDPEAFTAYQDNKRQAERLQDRIAMSEQLVRTQVGEEEYVKAETAFADEVQSNPALAVELRNHPNPAKFAYDIGKAALDRQEIGDPREYAAKQVAAALEAQKATMAEEIQKQVQEQVAKLVPKSLADNASAGERTTQTPVDDEPVPIDQLLPK